jgi:N-methylhydantoinase B
MNGAPVISGTDWRRGNKVYVNQMIPLLIMGAGGHYGADGWVTFGVPGTHGMMISGSIEVLEQHYPIKYDMCQAVTDSFGAGQWDGGPSMELAVGPRHDPTIVVSVSDTNKFPVKGVLGGQDSPLSRNQKFNIEKPEEKTDVPPFGVLVLQPNERLYIWKSGGGGYGEPLERDPELVRHRVREEWVSLEHARDVYGVVLDTKPEKYAVDYEGTKKLRETLKKKKGEKK